MFNTKPDLFNFHFYWSLLRMGLIDPIRPCFHSHVHQWWFIFLGLVPIFPLLSSFFFFFPRVNVTISNIVKFPTPQAAKGGCAAELRGWVARDVALLSTKTNSHGNPTPAGRSTKQLFSLLPLNALHSVKSNANQIVLISVGSRWKV